MQQHCLSAGGGESQDDQLSPGINSRLKGHAFLARSQGSVSLSSNQQYLNANEHKKSLECCMSAKASVAHRQIDVLQMLEHTTYAQSSSLPCLQ